MREKRGAHRLCAFAAALFIFSLFPAAAGAETRSFVNLTHLVPSDGAGTSGPANVYPSSITVSGLSGTVTNVKVSLIDYHSASPDDADVAITGPNGDAVMLMSDACGETILPGGPAFSTDDENWTFDDAAPTFISNGGPCSPSQEASFRPSNYLGNTGEPDDLSVSGGPPPPYLNALSFLTGGSPNGRWSLFMLDDNGVCCFGAGVSGWALTLEIQPSPAAAPQATGQRAAALAKCKSKKTKKARRKCRQKAQSLPV